MINAKQLLASEGFKNEWRENVDIETYHADKMTVSSSSLKKIIQVSPKTFRHTFFIAGKKELTKSMKLGRLAHMAILEGEKFKYNFIVEPIHEGRTKKGEITNSLNCQEVKDAKAAWWADLPPSAIVTTIEEKDTLLGMIDSLLSHGEANKYLSAGIAEVSGYYVDPDTGIACRVRPDFICRERRIITELKTSDDAREEAFRWKVNGERDAYWYDFQLAMQVEGFFQIENQPLELAAWIAIEPHGAYEVAVHPMTIPTQEVGHIKYRRALTRLKESIDTNCWPGIQNGETSFIVPTDAVMERYGVNYDSEKGLI